MQTRIKLLVLGTVVLVALPWILAGCHSSQNVGQPTVTPQASAPQPGAQDSTSSDDVAAHDARQQQDRQSGND